jgi:hypothetical protein
VIGADQGTICEQRAADGVRVTFTLDVNSESRFADPRQSACAGASAIAGEDGNPCQDRSIRAAA